MVKELGGDGEGREVGAVRRARWSRSSEGAGEGREGRVGQRCEVETSVS